LGRVRLDRLGAAGGIVLPLLWGPMLLVAPQLPDLASSPGIQRFYAQERETLEVVIALASFGFVAMLVLLGGLSAAMRRYGAPQGLILAAIASALVFMTTLAVALGIVAAANLTAASTAPDSIRELHATAFVLAAPVAPAGVAFFAAMTLSSERGWLLPRWMGGISLIAGIANLGALGGIFSLTGPLNAGNGTVGGSSLHSPPGRSGRSWSACGFG
jgi:hypothetical protein